MVTKVFNIQPFFISIICDLNFVNRNSFFRALSPSNSRSWCHVLQEKIIVYFAYLYTFNFLRLKQKMDSLLFLIKKHNNNKTVSYNDKLAHITFINKNE